MRGNTHVRFGGAGRGNGPTETMDTAPRPDPYQERLNTEIRRRTEPKRGSGKPTVYTYPSKKALAAITGKVKTISR